MMLPAMAALMFAAGNATGAGKAEPPKLTPEAINADMSLSGPSLRGARVSPDGALVTVLKGRPDNARQLDLWAYDVATGESRMLVSSTDLVGAVELSEEEKNRRERQRIYDDGITSYDWDDAGRRILVPLGGDIFVYDVEARAPRRLTETAGFETDAKFSPGGRYVSYVRDDDLFVYDLSTAKERRVTPGAKGTLRNAVAEFVAQEELDRDTGYWWSPGDARIAFTVIDEAPVPFVERVEIGAEDVKTIRQRYPFAGAANVTIRLGLTTPGGAAPVWVDLGSDPDIYLARVDWSKDGGTLYVQRLSRDQKRLDLIAANPKTGATRILLTETSESWINLNHHFAALSDGGFLWGSERSGFAKLYRYAADGTLVASLADGPGLVDERLCVDEAAGEVFYAGWRDSPLERHIFRAPLAGGAPTQVSSDAAWHQASYARNCASAIWTVSSDRRPPQTSVRGPDGAFRFWLLENAVAGDHPYAPYMAGHEDWRYGTLAAADGTSLDYKILTPRRMKRGAKLPAIILVYGGPHAQTVRNIWGDLFAQMLVDEGYVVFRLDNRGAWNRGTAFEASLHRDMGRTEVADQAVGAAYLKSLPFIDADRVGVYGWSYGGYMTLRMLTATPDLYRAGVAGAPVTDWALYDTAYTERYMGTPEGEAEAYRKGSVFADLDRLSASLLVIHGMADDNVVFQNSVKLMNALQQQGRAFELMTYPGEKHGFRATPNKIHRDRLILDFFRRHLKDGD